MDFKTLSKINQSIKMDRNNVKNQGDENMHVNILQTKQQKAIANQKAKNEF